MFKCALQASTELTVERLRLSNTVAHNCFIIILTMLSVEETVHTTSGSLPQPLQQMCVETGPKV